MLLTEVANRVCGFICFFKNLKCAEQTSSVHILCFTLLELEDDVSWKFLQLIAKSTVNIRNNDYKH